MTSTAEHRAIERLARRYEENGYAVYTRRDAHAQLPDELRQFVPDFVARRGDEAVIVELKRRGMPAPHLSELAERVRRHAGWRLDVLYLDAPGEDMQGPAAPADIEKTVAASNRLFSEGDALAAWLLLWSAFDAAAMRALPEETGAADGVVEPEALIKLLAYEGLVPDSDHDRLLELRQVRNRAAHGHLDVTVEWDSFDFLANVTRALLGPPEPGSCAA